jgi:hypothetical protein
VINDERLDHLGHSHLASLRGDPSSAALGYRELPDHTRHLGQIDRQLAGEVDEEQADELGAAQTRKWTPDSMSSAPAGTRRDKSVVSICRCRQQEQGSSASIVNYARRCKAGSVGGEIHSNLCTAVCVDLWAGHEPVSSGTRREYFIVCDPRDATPTGEPRRLPRILRAVPEARIHARAMTSIIEVGRNAWRRLHSDDSGVLVDAADYYHAVYWAVSRAQSYVLMSGWQFDAVSPSCGAPTCRPAPMYAF